MRATLSLLSLVAAVATALASCGSPLVRVVVSRTASTPDGTLTVFLNGKMAEPPLPVPVSGQQLRRGYWLSSDDQKVCVKLVFSPAGGAMEPREVAWNGETVMWTIGGAGPMGPPCPTGAGGMGGAAAAGRSGGGGTGAAGGRSGEGTAGRGGAGATGSGGAAGGTASSGGTSGQGGGPAGTGAAMSGSGGTAGRGGAPGASGGRGGQPSNSGGMMMTGSGGLGGRAMGSGGAMSSGGAGGLGGATSTGGATPTGGVMGPGTGGSAPTGGAGGGGSGGAGGRGGSGSGGMAGNGGRPGGTGGNGGGAPVPTCSATNSIPCTCAAYCAKVNSACRDNVFFPGGPGECLPTCQGFGWPESDAYLTTESPLPCRMNQLRSDLPEECLAASPTGGDRACGTHCQILCAAVELNCAGLSSPPYPNNDCLAKCQGTPFAFDAAEQLLTTSAGNGRDGNCRLYWAAYAGRMGLSPAQRDAACANAAASSDMCR